MRPALVLGLAVLLFPCPGTAQTFEITDQVSDATGMRRVASADLRPLSDRSYTGTHAAFQAVYEESPNGGAAWMLTIFGYASDTTAMGRASTAQVRADGSPVPPRRVTSKLRRLDASLLEIKQIVLTESGFSRLARADQVVVSIGPARFTLDRVRRTDLRLIQERLSASPPSRTSSQGTAVDTSGAEG